MFNDNQLKILAKELKDERVRVRSKSNLDLSYLEGFDLIQTANDIFGYGNWSYTISSLNEISQEINHNDNTVICYKAIIRLQVYDNSHLQNIIKEDVGFGSGISKTLAEAHESGAKEAVTDGLKRALRSFGNQFGNSLYDKSRLDKTNKEKQPTKQSITNTPQDYTSLAKLGLSVMEHNNNLVIIGDKIFSKRDSIKACGFKWDNQSKLWYKPITQEVA